MIPTPTPSTPPAIFEIAPQTISGFTTYTLKDDNFTLANGLALNAQLHLCVYGVNSPKDWQSKRKVIFHPPIGLSNILARNPVADKFTEGWGKHLIGPGKLLDTDKFIIICVDSLGGSARKEGNSTPAREILTQLGSQTKISLEDTTNLCGKLLKRDLAITAVDKVVGISLGSLTAYKWLGSQHTTFKEIIDICGGESLSAMTTEYLRIATAILDRRSDFTELGNQLESNLAKFESPRINAIARHLRKGLKCLSSNYESTAALKYARMLSLVYYLTPEYFENEQRFRTEGDCIDKVEQMGREYLSERNAVSERMQKESILYNTLDIEAMARAINKGRVKIKAFSVANDQLFPAKEQAIHLGELARLCPRLVKHRILKPSLIGHCAFTKEGFHI